jgi:hypothetical protein
VGLCTWLQKSIIVKKDAALKEMGHPCPSAPKESWTSCQWGHLDFLSVGFRIPGLEGALTVICSSFCLR